MEGADGKQEEVYNFRSDPRENGATVILTVDTSSFTGESSHFISTSLLHKSARVTSTKSDADDTDNGTSTGDYPSQGDPHPIGTYLFFLSIVTLTNSMVYRISNFRRAINGRSFKGWSIILYLPRALRFK
jgi:hypothetical protein